MKLLFRLFVLLLLALLVAPFALVYFSIQKTPLVSEVRDLTPEEIRRAKAFLAENDPRRLRDGQVRTTVVEERDLDLGLSYLLGLVGAAGSEVRVSDGGMDARATLTLPSNPVGRYVNVDTTLLQGAPIPSFVSLRVGRIDVPGPLANLALEKGLDLLYRDADARYASELLREVRMRDGRLAVTYRWESDAVQRLGARLIPPADQERLKVYTERLAAVTGAASGPSVSLHALMTPLFRLARERAAGGDAEAEGRAALMTLEAYVNGRGLGSLVPEARSWPRPARRKVTLQGRVDFPQHFLTSAVLSAVADSTVSDAIGLFKEVDDARGGSGFSFTDLMADRAGTRFGERLTASAASARRVVELTSAAAGEEALMPHALDLPERMNEAEFQRRFGGVGGAEYRRMAEEIERRLDGLALYR